ncbi:MAG: hypothetical protein IJ733_14360, partial [Lachnospiraceae bacterium]|nr:hypothetical protein [Lachnospiraceae bacterium]
FKSKIVSAEEKRKNISVESILVNYLEQRLEIAKPEGGDSEILFGAVSLKKDKTSGKRTYTVKNWEIYDDFKKVMEESGTEKEVVYIDLSAFSFTKDNYFVIKGNYSKDFVLIKLAANELNPVTSTFYEKNNVHVELKTKSGGKQKDLPSEKQIEFRTLQGIWNIYQSSGSIKADLSFYRKRGTSLYFRVCAEKNKLLGNQDISTEDTDIFEKLTDKNPLKIYKIKASDFASKELKVNIKKQAAGSGITANYSKRTIKIAKNVEYRFINKDGSLGTWNKAKENSFELNEKDFIDDAAGEPKYLSIEIRKILENKTDHTLTYSAVVPLSIQVYQTPFMIKGTEINQIFIQETSSLTKRDLMIKKRETSRKTFYDITNLDDHIYHAVIITSAKVPAPSVKTVTIKPKKTYSLSGKKTGLLYLRRADSSMEKIFASAFMKVDFVAASNENFASDTYIDFTSPVWEREVDNVRIMSSAKTSDGNMIFAGLIHMKKNDTIPDKANYIPDSSPEDFKVCYAFENTSEDVDRVYIEKISSTGKVLWTTIVDSDIDGYQWNVSVQELSNGNYAVFHRNFEDMLVVNKTTGKKVSEKHCSLYRKSAERIWIKRASSGFLSIDGASFQHVDEKGNTICESGYISTDTGKALSFIDILQNKKGDYVILAERDKEYDTSLVNNTMPYLIKCDKKGKVSTIIGGEILKELNVDLSVNGLLETGDGGYLVLGKITGGSFEYAPKKKWACCLIKYSPALKPLWTKIIADQDADMSAPYYLSRPIDEKHYLLYGGNPSYVIDESGTVNQVINTRNKKNVSNLIGLYQDNDGNYLYIGNKAAGKALIKPLDQKHSVETKEITIF